MSRFPTLCAFLFAALFVTDIVSGHTRIVSPNGGERVRIGTKVTSKWESLAKHNQLGWDRWYSKTDDNGPWIPIRMNMPVSQLSLEWTVPNMDSMKLRFRIRQTNVGFSYEDISDADSAIVPSLTGNGAALSVSSGNRHDLALDGGVQNADRNYWVVGSMTGTTPGLQLGSVTVPVSFDLYTVYTIHSTNTVILSNSFGKLDSMERGKASFQPPMGALTPFLVGFTFHHSFITFSGSTIHMASNSESVRLTL